VNWGAVVEWSILNTSLINMWKLGACQLKHTPIFWVIRFTQSWSSDSQLAQNYLSGVLISTDILGQTINLKGFLKIAQTSRISDIQSKSKLIANWLRNKQNNDSDVQRIAFPTQKCEFLHHLLVNFKSDKTYVNFGVVHMFDKFSNLSIYGIPNLQLIKLHT
jgi:hypothetical protein